VNISRSNHATIRDVARLAGVSVATISRYLNKTAVLSEKTTQLVETAVKDLKYIPQVTARNLANRKTGNLGLLLTEIQGDFFTPLLKGIESTTSANGYSLLISTYNNSHDFYTPAIGPHNTDGMLIFLGSLNNSIMEEFHQRDFPMVLIHQTPLVSLDIPCVTIENKSASYRIVSHLIESHHCQRIAYLNGPDDNEEAYWRSLGYKEALSKHDLEYDLGLVMPGNFDRMTAKFSTLQLLEKNKKIDAIFTGDDEAALGVLSALRISGIHVPEEMAVVGFDDQNLAQFMSPPLTTVHVPSEEVGQVAACQLLNLIKNEPFERMTLLPTEIVIRRSCGCSWNTVADNL
jgi:LacI family transcriptional regulator